MSKKKKTKKKYRKAIKKTIRFVDNKNHPLEYTYSRKDNTFGKIRRIPYLYCPKCDRFFKIQMIPVTVRGKI